MTREPRATGSTCPGKPQIPWPPALAVPRRYCYGYQPQPLSLCSRCTVYASAVVLETPIHLLGTLLPLPHLCCLGIRRFCCWATVAQASQFSSLVHHAHSVSADGSLKWQLTCLCNLHSSLSGDMLFWKGRVAISCSKKASCLCQRELDGEDGICSSTISNLYPRET